MLPLLLVAIIGFHMRPKLDDFQLLAILRVHSNGPAMAVHIYNLFSGSVTGWFVLGTLAPLGPSVVTVMPALISLLWLAGAFWLIYECLGFMTIEKQRIQLSLAIAALLVFASFYAFLSWRPIYWYATSTRYAMPFASVCALLAFLIRVARWRSVSVRALFGFFLAGFFSASFSEGASILHVTLLGLLIIFARTLGNRPLHTPLPRMLIAGWLGSIASFVMQYTSTGTANRKAWTAQQQVGPLQDLSQLIRRSVEDSVSLVANADTAAGIALLMLVGMVLALSLPLKSPSRERAPLRLSRPMIALALLFQVICLPILWSYVSDDAQILGRFSARYFGFISMNLLAIAGLALLFWRSPQVDGWMALQSSRFRVATEAVLILASTALLFEIPLLRIWVWHYALLTLICFALPFVLSPPFSLSRQGACILLLGMSFAWICQAALVAALLVARGIVFLRVLTPGPAILVFTGLCWGIFLGNWLRRVGIVHGERRRLLGAIALAAAVMLGALMFRAQLDRLAEFQSFARQWDINHASILVQRERGISPIVVDPMPPSFGSYIEDKYAIAYYGEPIVVRGES